MLLYSKLQTLRIIKGILDDPSLLHQKDAMKHNAKNFNDTKTEQRIQKDMKNVVSDFSLSNEAVEFGQTKQNITVKNHKKDGKTANR